MVAPKSRDLLKAGFLFLCAVMYLFIFVRVLWRVGDEGLVVYGAQLVAEGNLPYRDFFEVFGPGSFYWLALFFKVFGTKFFVARMVLLITSAVMIVLIYWMTRRLYQGPFEILPAFFYMVISIPLWPASSHHWDSNLFALLAIAMFFCWQDKGRNFYLLASGILAGLTSCFIQQKGLLIICSLLLVVLIESYRDREQKSNILTKLSLMSAGYIGVGGLVLTYFYIMGGFSDLIYANLIWPLSHYNNINTVPYGFTLTEFIVPFWYNILSAIFPTLINKSLTFLILLPLLTILALPLLVGIVSLGAYITEPKQAKMFGPLMLPYWVAGFALWISELHRPDLMHLIWGSPLFIIIFFVAWIKCWRNHLVIKNIGLVFLILCLITLGILYNLWAINAKTQLVTRRGAIYLFKPDEALKFLLKETRPGEEVFIYPYYPMYYFLADLKNPTKYNNLVYHYHNEIQFNEVINQLKEKRVRYILWDTLIESSTMKRWFPMYEEPPKEKRILEIFLENNYDVIGFKNGFRVLQHKSHERP